MAASALDPAYPLRVQILVGDSEGFGNILGSAGVGFHFVESCNLRLPDSHTAEEYQARWTEQDAKLEILVRKIGTKNRVGCELNVTGMGEPYSLSSIYPAPAAQRPAITPTSTRALPSAKSFGQNPQ